MNTPPVKTRTIFLSPAPRQSTTNNSIHGKPIALSESPNTIESFQKYLPQRSMVDPITSHRKNDRYVSTPELLELAKTIQPFSPTKKIILDEGNTQTKPQNQYKNYVHTERKQWNKEDSEDVLRDPIERRQWDKSKDLSTLKLLSIQKQQDELANLRKNLTESSTIYQHTKDRSQLNPYLRMIAICDLLEKNYHYVARLLRSEPIEGVTSHSMSTEIDENLEKHQKMYEQLRQDFYQVQDQKITKGQNKTCSIKDDASSPEKHYSRRMHRDARSETPRLNRCSELRRSASRGRIQNNEIPNKKTYQSLNNVFLQEQLKIHQSYLNPKK